MLSASATRGEVLAETPPMGWNSWNWWGKEAIHEKLMRETIDAIVESGLRDAGYEYFVVDGGWRDVKLSETGELLSHPKKFPSGMKALADYAHSKGLKFGLHTVPGTHDCGGDEVGAWDVEEIHVNQFIDWGVDFIKLDKCKFLLADEIPEKKWAKPWTEGWRRGDNLIDSYTKWRKLLDESPHPIVLSASAYQYHEWYPVLTQMGRTTGDIGSLQWGGAQFDTGHQRAVMTIVDQNNQFAHRAGSGYWNDPDMMVTGEQGLTLDQQRVHFALWCIMSSPLMLGNDPRNMTAEELAILTNRVAIEINQDPTEQGRRVHQENGIEIWLKNLKNGDRAVLLFNRNASEPRTAKLDFAAIGLQKEHILFDIWEMKALGTVEATHEVNLLPTSGQFLLLK